MKKQKDRIYITPVIKSKQTSYINFLRSLSIKKDDLIITLRGDFYIFRIDLSNMSDEEYGKVRKKLNQKQAVFFK